LPITWQALLRAAGIDNVAQTIQEAYPKNSYLQFPSVGYIYRYAGDSQIRETPLDEVMC
jgi:hypothetical protein